MLSRAQKKFRHEQKRKRVRRGKKIFAKDSLIHAKRVQMEQATQAIIGKAQPKIVTKESDLPATSEE